MSDTDRAERSRTELENELNSAPGGETDSAPPEPSLIDNLTALAYDGKTLFEAEIGFQKTRLTFAANRSKIAVLSGLMAIGFLHLALIALIVGALIGLTPYLTAFGATAVVVGALLIGALAFLSRACGSARDIGEAFDKSSGEPDD
ncbi:MAG: phage holin family protein [Proteobacteria bacterium]|nr:phage holin family protein [Pseudomonadota bacterium]MDA0914028.1 phage holin family protein [Pseudomonadota bacterium]MDA1033086.1 phage holin family protein [Pseudomonadota bacterium]